MGSFRASYVSLIAGLLLVLWGGASHAQTWSCPSGQVINGYKYIARYTGTLIKGDCMIGSTIVTTQEATKACFVEQHDYNCAVYSCRYSINDPQTIGQLGSAGINGRFNTSASWTSCNLTVGGCVNPAVNNHTTWEPICGEPEPEPECPSPGTPHPGVVGGLCIGSGCDADMCFVNDDTETQCVASLVNGIAADGATVGSWVYTGDTCDNSELTEDQTAPEGCAVNLSTGQTICITEPNCGTVNGDAFCYSEVPASNCITTSSGGLVCTGNAPTPPAPDDGTPGNPADPDAEIAGPGGNHYNYFNSTTVGNSTGEEGEGGGGECQGEECPPTGEGDGYCEGLDCVPKALPEARTFGESIAHLGSGVSGTDFGGAISGLRNLPDGSAGGCVNPSINVFNEDFEFPMCQFFVPFIPWIRAIAILAWAIVAIRVFLEA